MNRLAIFPMARLRQFAPVAPTVSEGEPRVGPIEMLPNELLLELLMQLKHVDPPLRLPIDVYNFGLVSRRWRAAATRFAAVDQRFRESRGLAFDLHLETIANAVDLAAARASAETAAIDRPPPGGLVTIFSTFRHVRLKLPPGLQHPTLDAMKTWMHQLPLRHLDLIAEEGASPDFSARQRFEWRLAAAATLLTWLTRHPGRAGIIISMSLSAPSSTAPTTQLHASFLQTLKDCDMVDVLGVRHFPGLPALLYAMPQLNQLTRLDLRSNQIADVPADARNASVGQVATMMVRCTRLKSVDLRENRISKAGRNLLQTVASRRSIRLLLDPDPVPSTGT